MIFIPRYCYSWHYNKVWWVNLTWDKPKTDWIEYMNRQPGTRLTHWGGWVGRAPIAFVSDKVKLWDNACQCFLLCILICISLINPQGCYLQFRWHVNSLRIQPFLLALGRQRRFARRNVCDSATEILYLWHKICPESGQELWLVVIAVVLFDLLCTNDRQKTREATKVKCKCDESTTKQLIFVEYILLYK